MYQDLRSKLAMYKDKQNNVSSARRKGPDVHELLDGIVACNDHGTCFVLENSYPLSYIHGGINLGDALNLSVSTLGNLCPDLRDTCLENSSGRSRQWLKSFLFFDIETTGLSGGAGTVAFLVGTGFFTEEAFVLRQYFMRDYDEEPSMLVELNRLFGDYEGFVTFNGKSFDWNIIQSRFAFNRIRSAINEPLHIDLLFPSRVIWKLKLESCRLSSLEENVLGEIRVDDVSGELIPGIYFKYLDDRNAVDIVKVIKHNQLDILSMVSLLTKICSMLEDPLSGSECEKELLGVGRILEKSGKRDVTIDCYQACARSDNFTVKELASRRLGDMYKKAGDYEKAAKHWNDMLAGSDMTGIYPMVELAKYYEHKAKDFQKAMDMVNMAIDRVSRFGIKDGIIYYELKKRLERLKRKAGRNGNA